MAKSCPEEFNPWPPFVDIFASVILVLMLFLLITVVNIGYYAQYKFKKAYSGSVESAKVIHNEESTKNKIDKCEKQLIVVDTNQISFHKVDATKLEKDANASLFSGGKDAGNVVDYAQNPTPKYSKQSATQKNKNMVIKFENQEIFLSAKVKRDVNRFVAVQKRKNKNVVFEILVSDPENIVSKTLAKQASLGRALNMKKVILKNKIKPQNVKLKLQKNSPYSSEFGTLLIKVEGVK